MISSPASTPLLALDRVSRRLAGREVVHALDLAVHRGEVLGLLGVNGAGKSTTLRMMIGVLAPSSGTVRFDGDDLAERPSLARRGIGYLPETPPLHLELSAAEYLGFCARLHGVPRSGVRAAVARALERCELGDVARRPLGTLSKGFRQRVGIAQAIVHEPALVVLDEPASGLDPVQAVHLRHLIRSLGESHAVVLSTHILHDVAVCCDHVAILHRGRLRHVGAIAGGTAGEGCIIEPALPMAAAQWAELTMVENAEPLANGRWRIALRPGSRRAELAAALVAGGHGVALLTDDADALETTFLAIASREPEAEAA